MKLLKTITITLALLIPVAAIAAPAVTSAAADCCPCCPPGNGG
jgi:hypothetical protein